MRFHKLAKQSLALLLGLILVFVIFEAGIRIWGSLTAAKVSPTAIPAGEFEILALGNSHTNGAGVPQGTAYSYVLENFFRKERPDFKVRVVNGGLPNGNTSHLMDKLDTFFEISRPDVVLIMAGEPNIWNKYGISRYKARKDGDGSLGSIVENVLNHSRLYRWFSVLLNLHAQSKHARHRSQDLELDALEILSIYEQGTLGFRLGSSEADRLKKTILTYLDKSAAKPLRTRWVYYCILSSLEKDPDLSVDYLKKSILAHKGLSNYCAALVIDGLLVREKNSGRLKQLQELRKLSRANSPDEKEFRKEMDAFHSSIYPTPLTQKDLAFLERVRVNGMISSGVTNRVVSLFLEQREPMKVAIVLRELLENNPLTSRESESFLLLSHFADTNDFSPEVRNFARETRKTYMEKYPSEGHRFFELRDDELSSWVMSDLEELSERIQSYQATPVLQTYHWLRNQKEDGLLNESIRELSRRKNLRLSDTNLLFRREILADGDEESFFTHAFGRNDSHPSEKGHRLIARIIYDYLEKNKLLPPELMKLPAQKIYRYKHEQP